MNSDMNLNLNLGPYPPPSAPPYPENDIPAISDLWTVNCENWIGSPDIPVSMERVIPAVVVDNTTSRENKDEKKPDQGSFFDCNICLGISKDPVVTCCGHLFCWSCLYQWLVIHSDVQECPVCKGEVTLSTVTPIYGHGHDHGTDDQDHGHVIENDLSIPARPQANRVESWRQTIDPNLFVFPHEFDEMYRSFENTHNYIPEEIINTTTNNNNDAILLDDMMASRTMMQNLQQQVDEVVDSTTAHSRLLSRVMMRTQPAHRVIALAHAAAFNQRQQQQQHNSTLSGDDRDSVSSIVAVIQGSQAGEIDSASSSRRAVLDGSNMDSGDSRPQSRRRRL